MLRAVPARTGDLRDRAWADAPGAFREAGARVIEGLAEDAVPAGAVSNLDGAFARLRDALAGVDPHDPGGCDQAHVIVYAAGSMRDRLASSRERPRGRVGWAARVTTRRART